MATWACVRAFVNGDRSPYCLDYATPHPEAEPDALLTRLTNEYDPERQIVVMFVEDANVMPLEQEEGGGRPVWSEGPQGIWIVNGHVSPRDAQARRAN